MICGLCSEGSTTSTDFLQELIASTASTAKADEKSFFIEVLFLRVIGFESRATQIATTKIHRKRETYNLETYAFLLCESGVFFQFFLRPFHSHIELLLNSKIGIVQYNSIVCLLERTNFPVGVNIVAHLQVI